MGVGDAVSWLTDARVDTPGLYMKCCTSDASARCRVPWSGATLLANRLATPEHGTLPAFCSDSVRICG